MGVFVVLFIGRCIQQVDFPVLKGPYLGQDPPGRTPEIFAPGIISKGYAEYQINFTHDKKELFLWLGEDRPYCVILCMKEEQDVWSPLQVCSFSGQYVDMKFTISPDGQKFIFSSNRPRTEMAKPSDNLDIWYIERSSSGWGEPVRYGLYVNTDSHDYCPSISGNGNLYFMSDRDDGIGEDDIYVSPFMDGKLTKAVNIGPAINTPLNDGDPFVAPDESYLIFCSRDREEGFGNNDLYISFRDPDGSWSQAVNMGDMINTPAEEVCPFVTYDGKYFFFSSNRKKSRSFPESPLTYEQVVQNLAGPGNGSNDIYWVDAGIIEDFKPKELK